MIVVNWARLASMIRSLVHRKLLRLHVRSHPKPVSIQANVEASASRDLWLKIWKPPGYGISCSSTRWIHQQVKNGNAQSASRAIIQNKSAFAEEVGDGRKIQDSMSTAVPDDCNEDGNTDGERESLLMVVGRITQAHI